MALANTDLNTVLQGGGELFYNGISLGILSEDEIKVSGLTGEIKTIGSSSTGDRGVKGFYSGSKPVIEAMLRQLDKFKLVTIFGDTVGNASIASGTPTVGQLSQNQSGATGLRAGKAINPKILVFYPFFDGYISDTNNPYAIRFNRAIPISDLSTGFNPKDPSKLKVVFEALENFSGACWEWANAIVA